MSKLLIAAMVAAFGFSANANANSSAGAGVGANVDNTRLRILDDRIIGGSVVKANEPIGQVTVGVGDQKGAFCTGVLIAEDIALTAAHCADDFSGGLLVYFGTDIREVEKIETRAVVAVLLNPRWETNQNQEFNTGDIAILRFHGGLPSGFYGAEIMPANLDLHKGQPVELAGYGYTDNQGNGFGILRKTKAPILNAHFSDTEVEIDQSQGTGSCNGDSGGPAFIHALDGRTYVWGITSRGDRSCAKNGIYTAVVPYYDWISETVGRLRSSGKYQSVANF